MGIASLKVGPLNAYNINHERTVNYLTGSAPGHSMCNVISEQNTGNRLWNKYSYHNHPLRKHKGRVIGLHEWNIHYKH